MARAEVQNCDDTYEHPRINRGSSFCERNFSHFCLSQLKWKLRRNVFEFQSENFRRCIFDEAEFIFWWVGETQ